MHKPVIHIHDGAVEEYMATALITTMSTADLWAVVVVDGDCLGGIATQAAYQLNQWLGNTVPVGLSAARPKNPFPWQYRGDCILQSQVLSDSGAVRNPDWPFAGSFDDTWPPKYPPGDPSIIHVGEGAWVEGFPSGELLLIQQLTTALTNQTPVTIAITGPPTPLITVIDERPDLADAIEEVVWYGPSLDGEPLHLWPVPKDVYSVHTDWNAFWDPYATKRLFDPSPFKVTMIPGTLAQTLSTKEFLGRLQTHGSSSLQHLAAASYAEVADEKETVMWDTLTVSYLGAESESIFLSPETRRLRSFEAGPLQGVVTEDDGGVETKIYKSVNKQAFFDYVFDNFGAV